MLSDGNFGEDNIQKSKNTVMHSKSSADRIPLPLAGELGNYSSPLRFAGSKF